MARWTCPECGERAVKRAPRGNVPWAAHGLPVPKFSHRDGTALCPVVGKRGYQPAQPQRHRK